MQNSLRTTLRGVSRSGRITRAALRNEVWRTFLLVLGTALAALGYVTFQVPHNLAAGGLSGISIIVTHYTGLPVGLLYWLMNLPLLVLGYRSLGRWPFVLRTLGASTLFALTTDVLNFYLPEVLDPYPVSNDLLLNTVYGGIVGGIGGGLIYRSGSTMGGTGIIGRMIQQRTGQPLSQAYFYTDGVILVTMGIVFGWEVTLYGLMMLLLNGMASDYTLEGSSNTRVATIVTNRPQEMAAALMETLGRGVTFWPVTGSYSGQQHTMLMCTVYRPQVGEVRRVVADVDPRAFVTISLSHHAWGEGFMPLRGKREARPDEREGS